MLLNCDVGEDSWESLGQKRGQTCQSCRNSVLNIHWKDWCWSWSSNTLAIWCADLTHWKRPWWWERWRQEEKGMTEDEIVGCYHQLNGHEFEQALEVSDGLGSLVCCSPWSCKESDTTEQLNWTFLVWLSTFKFHIHLYKVFPPSYIPGCMRGGTWSLLFTIMYLEPSTVQSINLRPFLNFSEQTLCEDQEFGLITQFLEWLWIDLCTLLGLCLKFLTKSCQGLGGLGWEPKGAIVLIGHLQWLDQID